MTSRNWKKRGGLSTHHRKIAITLRIFYQWGSNFQRILTIYRTSIYHKFGAATKLLEPKMLFSQSYDYSNITKVEIVINFRKKYFGLQIFRIWQIYVLLTLSKNFRSIIFFYEVITDRISWRQSNFLTSIDNFSRQFW